MEIRSLAPWDCQKCGGRNPANVASCRHCSPSSSTQGEETAGIPRETYLRHLELALQNVNLLEAEIIRLNEALASREAEARAARLAQPLIEAVGKCRWATDGGWLGTGFLPRRECLTHIGRPAICEALSAIAELNQGGQHAE